MLWCSGTTYTFAKGATAIGRVVDSVLCVGGFTPPWNLKSWLIMLIPPV
jgi:hypothetical protein